MNELISVYLAEVRRKQINWQRINGTALHLPLSNKKNDNKIQIPQKVEFRTFLEEGLTVRCTENCFTLKAIRTYTILLLDNIFLSFLT